MITYEPILSLVVVTHGLLFEGLPWSVPDPDLVRQPEATGALLHDPLGSRFTWLHSPVVLGTEAR